MMARHAAHTLQDYDDTDVPPVVIGRAGWEPPPEALLEAQLQALKAKDRDLIDTIAQQQESIRERDAHRSHPPSAPSQAMLARIVELEASHEALKRQMTNLVTIKDNMEKQLHSVPADQPSSRIVGNISTVRHVYRTLSKRVRKLSQVQILKSQVQSAVTKSKVRAIQGPHILLLASLLFLAKLSAFIYSASSCSCPELAVPPSVASLLILIALVGALTLRSCLSLPL